MLKEVRYYQIDEATARDITAVFKERVYELAPGASPEQILVEIAEKEFGLARLALPEAARTQIIQRLDSPTVERPRVIGVPLAGRPAEVR